MPPRATRSVENSFHRLGYPRVAGVDEVGRGCLAGPVAVGVVVLDPRRPVPGLRDSKLLTGRGPRAAERPHPARRARLGGRLGRAGRDRHRQHPPGVAPGHGARRHGPRSAAVGRPGRRVRHPRPAAPAARDHRRRSAVCGHRRGVDCGEGRPGPINGVVARRRSSVWVRPAQGLRDSRTSGGRLSARVLACSSAIVPVPRVSHADTV